MESASKQSLGLPPVLTAHLLPKVDAKLLELLRSLDAADWDRPTIVPGWKVRDIVAHLLDTALRKLSVVRDRHFTTGPKSPSPEDVRAFVDAANADGIRFYGKLSAPVLVTMMERASKELCDFSLALDPYAPATFPVSWAGESESQNWFDTARELTERWHHQQQIRLAAGHEGIMTRELYHPVLDTFMRALPFSYRDVAAPAGTRLQITVTGACGGHWHLVRGDSAWIFTLSAGNSPAARLEVPQEIAWRIFTKGIARPEAESRCGVSGDPSLTEKFFSTLAIVG